MKNLKLFSMLGIAVFVLSGCQAVQNKEGFFYSIFVKPMEFLLSFSGMISFRELWFSNHCDYCSNSFSINADYAKNYRQQQLMKTKMDAFKPEMEAVQKK